MTYLTNANQAICQLAADQIAENCQLPTDTTACWDVPHQTVDGSLWFIACPPNSGWTRDDGITFTRAQMLDGVVEMTEQNSQADWFPPIESGE